MHLGNESRAQTDYQPSRILVVEANDAMRVAIATALEQENYEVLTAADGQTGLTMLRQEEKLSSGNTAIDLLILDLLLPDMNGLEICRTLRNQESPLPIFMISDKTEEADRIIGLEMGADDYLSKPFGFGELIARCRALLRRVSIQIKLSQTVLEMNEIVLNLTSRQVTVRGKNVILAPQEFLLLELFMRYPHQIFSREQLINKVWGNERVENIKTVDVHINRLRRKVELDPSVPQHLLTVRGFGYRFD